VKVKGGGRGDEEGMGAVQIISSTEKVLIFNIYLKMENIRNGFYKILNIFKIKMYIIVKEIYICTHTS
jgi:hypothetical protein